MSIKNIFTTTTAPISLRSIGAARPFDYVVKADRIKKDFAVKAWKRAGVYRISTGHRSRRYRGDAD
jgi:hypothetical protein